MYRVHQYRATNRMFGPYLPPYPLQGLGEDDWIPRRPNYDDLSECPEGDAACQARRQQDKRAQQQATCDGLRSQITTSLNNVRGNLIERIKAGDKDANDAWEQVEKPSILRIINEMANAGCTGIPNLPEVPPFVPKPSPQPPQPKPPSPQPPQPLPSKPAEGTNWWLVGGALAAVGVVGYLAYSNYKKR